MLSNLFPWRLILYLSDERWVGSLEDYVEAQAAEERSGGCFDVDAPGALHDSGFYRVGAVPAAASAANGKLDAAHCGPSTLCFVELPLVENFCVERSGRKNSAVGVDGRAGRAVKCFHGAEKTQQAMIFGLHGVIPFLISGDGVMHACILQRQGNGRNEIQEVKEINGQENRADADANRPASDNQVLAGDGLQKAQKKIKQCQAECSAEQKDERSDCMQHDRQNVNHEAEQREEKETELKSKTRKMRFQPFIGRKGRAKHHEKWPAGPQAAAAKIENEKCAEQPAKKELQRIDEPEAHPGRVSGNRGNGIASFRAVEIFCEVAVFSAAQFFRAVGVFRSIDKEDAPSNHREVRNDPEIFPKRIHALERYSVKCESPEQRDRGNRSFEASIGRTELGARRLAKHFVRHRQIENSMRREEACAQTWSK